MPSEGVTAPPAFDLHLREPLKDSQAVCSDLTWREADYLERSLRTTGRLSGLTHFTLSQYQRGWRGRQAALEGVEQTRMEA